MEAVHYFAAVMNREVIRSGGCLGMAMMELSAYICTKWTSFVSQNGQQGGHYRGVAI